MMLRPPPALRPPVRPHQNGAALLTAMLVVALVTTLASAAMWQQWRAVEVETAERSRVQSAWLLTGGLDWARLILRQDTLSASSSRSDHLGEPWAMPLSESRLSTFLSSTPDSNGADDTRPAFLSGSISDLQARFNIGNLMVGGRLSQPWQSRLQRLFEVLNLPESELDSLVQGLQKTFVPAGNPMPADAPLPPTQLEHLAWFGLSQSTLQALRPHAAWVAVHEVIPVNINTASAEVIYAVAMVDPGNDSSSSTPNATLALSAARSLVEARENTAFRDLSMPRMVLTQQGHNEAVLGNIYFGVSSSRFEVRGRLRLDDLSLEERSHVQRRGNLAHVIERQRTTVSTPAPGGMDYTSLQSQFGQ